MAEIRPFAPSKDRTPRYTVKEVSELTGLSAYTIRYYENSGLIPSVDRTDGNIRMFSEYALSWLRLVHCLRATRPADRSGAALYQDVRTGRFDYSGAGRNDLPPGGKPAPAARISAAAVRSAEIQKGILQTAAGRTRTGFLQSGGAAKSRTGYRS